MSQILQIKSSEKIFAKYTLLADMQITVTTKSPIRIGGTPVRQSPLESDLPTIKNVNGIPIIPGSSLKGFFRANLTRLLGQFGITEKLLNPLFGGTNPEETASALLFQDLVAKQGSYKLKERTHIRIDPELGSVARGGLFNVEAVMDNSTFEGTLLKARNVHPAMLGLIYAVIQLTNEELFKIGGLKSRGYGTIQCTVKELVFKIPGKPLKVLASGNGATIEPLIGFEGFTTESIKVSSESEGQNMVTFSSLTESLKATTRNSIEVLGAELVFTKENAEKFFGLAIQRLQEVLG